MNKIKILPENLASKIAAGEVIQRPASVVKELLENSIDAGATKIIVIIKDGGKSLIQVIDNGCGMEEEDAIIAFQRHATSKISSLEDLENIRTLGFRGEALASVAAVSQVELITRTDYNELSTKIRVEGVDVKETTKTTSEVGTSVSVKNLFFNTPARRNFLKNSNTEFKHIFDVVIRIAISNHDLALKLISDDEVVLNLRPAEILERIKNVFGEKLLDSLIRIEKSSGLIGVSGFISKPDFSRKTRNEQFIFLNNRYIISRNLNFAVHQAYENLLEKGNFPFFILYLEIDPRRVDVNVHPAKLEVKFQDERGIYHAINSAVRNTLVTSKFFPNVQIQINESGAATLSRVYIKDIDKATSNNVPAQLIQVLSSEKSKTDDTFPAGIKNDRTIEAASSLKYFQIHNQYIITQVEDGVLIIDQHAAHERVLYEKAITNIYVSNKTSQQLLFPYIIELNAGDMAIVKELSQYFENLGFQIKIFGKNTVSIEGVPPDVKPAQEDVIFKEILDLYKENENNLKLEPRENLAKSFACKTAIKFGDALTQTEMSSLIEQLFLTKIPNVCPHGRPVFVKIPLSELGKRLGR